MNNITVAGRLYLKYCDSQPLPLFEPTTFIQSLHTRDPEIILCVLALGLRFAETNSIPRETLYHAVADKTRSARGLVMSRIAKGKVELSTLQSLCLLSLLGLAGKIIR